MKTMETGVKRVLLTLVSGLMVFGVEAQTSDIHVNVNVEHSIGGVNQFDRQKYINIHASLTEGDWDGEADKMEYVINDLDVYLGRDNGSMGWYMNQADEDPARPGYVDPAYMSRMGQYVRETVYGVNHSGKHKYEDNVDMLVGGQERPFWPGQTTSPYDGSQGWEIGGADASGDYMGRFFNQFFRNPGEPSSEGKKRPRFMEIINEPLYELVTTGDHTPLEVFEYHNTVADAIREHNPDIMIGGYTTAFPFFDENNFQRWEDRMKLFYDVSGENMDFFSIHLYDFNKHHLGDGNPSTFDGPVYFKGGRMEATFDMMEQYSMLKWDFVKPMLISEFGGRDHSTEWKDWSPERDWQFMKAFSPMLLSFMDRPDIIIKAIPFIVNKAEWGRTQVPYPWRLMRQAFEAEGETGDHWVFTEMIKFYELWSDVNGTRIDTRSGNPDILVDGYVAGNKIYIIANNLNLNPEDLSLKLFENNDNVIQSVAVKHLYFDGQKPVLKREDLTPGDNLTYTLDTEATAVFEYTFEQDVLVDEFQEETKYYANTYLRPVSANVAQSFEINGVNLGQNNNAVLRIGMGRDHDKAKKPDVVFNGTSLIVPDNYSGDDQALRDQFFGLLEVHVPDSVLKVNNTIDVEFPDDGGHISTVTMQVFNSSVQLEHPAAQDDVGIKDVLDNKFIVFPNPNKGNFYIDVPEELSNAEVNIVSPNGKLVYYSKMTGTRADISLNLSSGIS